MIQNDNFSTEIKKIQEAVDASPWEAAIWNKDIVYYYFECRYTKEQIKDWQFENIPPSFQNRRVWSKKDIKKFSEDVVPHKRSLNSFPTSPVNTYNTSEVKEKIKLDTHSDSKIKDLQQFASENGIRKYYGNNYRWTEDDVLKMENQLYSEEEKKRQIKLKVRKEIEKEKKRDRLILISVICFFAIPILFFTCIV